MDEIMYNREKEISIKREGKKLENGRELENQKED